MPWKIEFIPEAEKTLARLGPEAANRIMNFMRGRVSTLENPRRLGESLRNPRFAGLWRYRIGDYRIICDIQGEQVLILAVLAGHRREVNK